MTDRLPSVRKLSRPQESWRARLVRSLLYGRNVDRAAKARARVGFVMLAFVAIWFAGICISVLICVATALWIFPLKQVEFLGAIMVLGWTLASTMLVKRMSSPGGRLSLPSE